MAGRNNNKESEERKDLTDNDEYRDFDREDKGEVKKELPPIKETEASILEVVKGQDEHVRTIITAVYRSINLGIKANVLVMGPSGSGKTEILKQLAEKLNLVYVIEDANDFTQEGYHGRDVTKIVNDLMGAANDEIEKAEEGIVIIDELDKKAARQTLERDVSGLGVLNSLLKLIEGKTIRMCNENLAFDFDYDPDIDDFHTEKLIIFFAGAFSDMERIKKLKSGGSKIGFSHMQENERRSSSQNRLSEIQQDLIDYGFPEEFVGRIDTIVQLNKLSEDDLVNILKNSKASIFRKYQNKLKKEYGIRLKYSPNIFRDIARKAKGAKTGARELSNIVNGMFTNILYEIFSAEPGEIHVCILREGIEEDNTRYILK